MSHRDGEALDVAVVGAGLAGLSCALWLHEHAGARVAVLEATSRVGGRALSVPLERGGTADLGGNHVGPCSLQPRVRALLARFGIEAAPQTHDGGEEEERAWADGAVAAACYPPPVRARRCGLCGTASGRA